MKFASKFEKKLSPLFKKIEGKLNAKAKLAIGAVALAALAFALYPQPNDITQSSVMITNIAGNSGGTGIIISSDETHSEILTNNHVCRVVERGGLVTGRSGQFLVASYRKSQMHDLCMITVEGNLKANTKVASKAPVSYYENALVSGHPQLMPNVVTSGHFSGRKVISVMRGIKPCTDAQAQDPETAMLCLFVGGIPDIMQYDSTLVTATIMAGSSGSGVYNEKKELAGVVFAGSGDLSYGWTVPFESMKNFLDSEVNALPDEKPDNTVDILARLASRRNVDEATMIEKLKETCEGPNRDKIKDTCRLVSQDLIYNK
jgi:S1-C subfamily serine protease